MERGVLVPLSIVQLWFGGRRVVERNEQHLYYLLDRLYMLFCPYVFENCIMSYCS
jgi:hypothetical protein